MKRIFGSYLIAAFTVGFVLIGINSAHAVAVQSDSEVQLSAGFSHAQNTQSGNFNADFAYGYYLSPGWELGFRQALDYNFINHAQDAWHATTTPFLHYNFHFNKVLVPYLGLQGGVVWNDRDVTGTMGPAVGVKLFVADQTFINIGYRYDWFFTSFEEARHNASHGNHVANIGLGFVWGGSGDRQVK
jgi:hypothetical protein